MSLDKRLRDHRDAHRSAFEAPVSLPALQGRVIGWQDGGYLIQQGADRRIKQSATNGTIGVGDVVAARNRIDAQRTRKVELDARSQVLQTRGKIKVLFSTIEGEDRVFYVGGDRIAPKRIHSIPASRLVRQAKISNAGQGDLYFVGLKHSAEISNVYEDAFTYESTKITFSGQTQWAVNYILPPISKRSIYYDPFFKGHGFWAQSVINYNGLGTNTTLTSFSQFLGEPRVSDGIWIVRPTADLLTPYSEGSVPNAIAPNIDKLSSSALYNLGGGTFDLIQSVALGKNAATAIYNRQLDDYHSSPGQFFSTDFLVDCVSRAETVLGGDMSWRSDLCNSFNLIGTQGYELNLGDSASFDFVQQVVEIPDESWNPTQSKNLTIDIYDMGTNTTKRSITSKVFAIKPDAQIHSLSYHP